MVKEEPTNFVDWLHTEMEKRGWSVRQTARAGGISHTPLSYALNGDQPSYDTCAALATAFGIPREEVLILAGLLPKPPQYNPKLERIKLILSQLSENDQDEVLALIELKRDRAEKSGKSEKKRG